MDMRKNIKTGIRTKTYTLLYMACIAALGMLPSCVKDELYGTPHPGRGALAVTVSPPQGGDPGDYTVAAGGQALENRDGIFVTTGLLEPGGYTVLAYNTPVGFDIGDGIARVRTVDVPGAPGAPATLIDPLPGSLYSGRERVTVIADDTTRVSMGVSRRVRDLEIRLDITEGDHTRIVTVEGTLTGVAGAYDMLNETLCGEPAVTSPAFTHGGGRITASLRLPGTMGDVQTLTLRIIFSDGQEQEVVSDLTAPLSGFNSGDKTQPVTVTGELRVPMEAGFSATIGGWQTAIGEQVEVN